MENLSTTDKVNHFNWLTVCLENDFSECVHRRTVENHVSLKQKIINLRKIFHMVIILIS